MDRDAIASRLRRAYAYARIAREQAQSSGLPFVQFEAATDLMLEQVEALARDLLGPSFSFEPDMSRTTDATPARMSGLRPVASAAKPGLSVIPGGARPEERPSARYIDDSADDAPKAG